MSCSVRPSSILISNPVDIPSQVMSEVKYTPKEIPKNSTEIIKNSTLNYNYLLLYTRLQVCNVKLEYIRNYINRYNNEILE